MVSPWGKKCHGCVTRITADVTKMTGKSARRKGRQLDVRLLLRLRHGLRSEMVFCACCKHGFRTLLNSEIEVQCSMPNNASNGNPTMFTIKWEIRDGVTDNPVDTISEKWVKRPNSDLFLILVYTHQRFCCSVDYASNTVGLPVHRAQSKWTFVKFLLGCNSSADTDFEKVAQAPFPALSFNFLLPSRPSSHFQLPRTSFKLFFFQSPLLPSKPVI